MPRWPARRWTGVGLLLALLMTAPTLSATSITLEQAKSCNCVDITGDLQHLDVQSADAYWWAPYWRQIVTVMIDGGYLYYIWFW